MNKAGLREQRKQEIHGRIMRAARTLMVENGFEKTTMRALANAAGVGLGTISLHFTDKTTLLLSAFHEEINEVALSAVESVSPDASLREQLVSIVRSLYRYYEPHTHFLRPVVKEALFATGEWKERFDVQLAQFAIRVAGLVETAKVRGEVRMDADSMSLAAVGWSLYISGLIQGLNAERFDPDAQTEVVASQLDIVLNGVLTRSHHAE